MDTYMFTFMRMHIIMCIYTHVHTHAHRYMYTGIHAHSYPHTYVAAHTYTCTHIQHTNVYTCIGMHRHIHTCMHKHAGTKHLAHLDFIDRSHTTLLSCLNSSFLGFGNVFQPPSFSLFFSDFHCLLALRNDAGIPKND